VFKNGFTKIAAEDGGKSGLAVLVGETTGAMLDMVGDANGLTCETPPATKNGFTGACV